MPCPHYDIKIVQRSKRQSAVAAAAYQLCYPQLVGTIQLSGGRRHVKKYIWSF